MAMLVAELQRMKNETQQEAVSVLKGLGTEKTITKNRQKKAFYKQTRGNFSKSLSYCEWDPAKIWYSDDFFLNTQSL